MTRQYFAENCFIQSGASFAFAREKLTNLLPLQDPQKGFILLGSLCTRLHQRFALHRVENFATVKKEILG